MAIFLVGLVSMILMRTLRKDYARYSREEELDDLVSVHYILVKVPLRVHYANYCTRGVVERLIQHKLQASAVSASKPHTECKIRVVYERNGALMSRPMASTSVKFSLGQLAS